nr:MAG TPA: hypothetical protein [Bacteriophage sp.]DAU89674.1 MAG TPA: hypothetical protein [Caudoviricetes sp.]
MLLWSIICRWLVLIRQGYCLRSALLVSNCSRHRPGFISSARYRFPVVYLFDLQQ